MENTTFDNNFVNFSQNVTTFGMLIDFVKIDKLHDFGSLVTEMYVCIKWPGTARVMIHIPLE